MSKIHCESNLPSARTFSYSQKFDFPWDFTKLTKLIRNEAIRLVPKKGRIKVQKIGRKEFS